MPGKDSEAQRFSTQLPATVETAFDLLFLEFEVSYSRTQQRKIPKCTLYDDTIPRDSRRAVHPPVNDLVHPHPVSWQSTHK